MSKNKEYYLQAVRCCYKRYLPQCDNIYLNANNDKGRYEKRPNVSAACSQMAVSSEMWYSNMGGKVVHVQDCFHVPSGYPTKWTSDACAAFILDRATWIAWMAEVKKKYSNKKVARSFLLSLLQYRVDIFYGSLKVAYCWDLLHLFLEMGSN